MCDIECVFQSMSGKGSIFISNLAAAQNLPLLQAKGIQAVLSAARSGLLQHSKEAVPYYLYLPADDHEEYSIERYFPQTYDFIEQARKQTNVLVHCMAGISRSVTIVIAYLIKKFKYSLQELLPMMLRKRSKINPNRGFVEQLKRYALQEGGRCAVKPGIAADRQRQEESVSCTIQKQEEPEKTKEYILTNPLAKQQQDKCEILKTLERTASTKEDISEFSKKSEQLKQDNALKSCILNSQDSLELAEKTDPLKHLQFTPIALRRRFSYEIRTDKQEKKLTVQEKASIEEKIMKVREKFQQKPGIKQSGMIKQTLPSKGQESGRKEGSLHHLKLMLEKKKSSKPCSEYLSLNTMESSIITNPTAKTHLPCPEEFYINFCQTETERPLKKTTAKINY